MSNLAPAKGWNKNVPKRCPKEVPMLFDARLFLLSPCPNIAPTSLDKCMRNYKLSFALW